MIFMNSYKNALEKIKITKEMENRIMRNLRENNISQSNICKKSKIKWLKPVALTVGCCAIVASSIFIYPKLQNNDFNNDVQLVNPTKDVSSINELKTDLPFELEIPTKLPKEYTLDSTSIISGTLAQIEYISKNDSITFRMTPGNEDISGDYNNYSKEDKITIDGIEVTIKGDDRLYKVITWNNDNFSYSLTTTAGLSEDIIHEIIRNIK